MAFIIHTPCLRPIRPSSSSTSTTLSKRPRPLPRLCSDPNPRPTSAPPTSPPAIPTSSSSSSSNSSSSTTTSSPSPDITATTPTSTGPHVSFSLGSLSFSIPSRYLLYSVPFFWGSFGPAVRLLYAAPSHPEPAIFNTERLILSTLFYVPILVSETSRYLSSRGQNATPQPANSFAFVRAGLELGLFVFFANVAQVLGLQQTSASRAAFLVQTQTVIVPVLAGLFGLDRISPRTWAASVVAVLGVALLSSDKGHGTVSSLSGDALEVLSALFFSTYIIRLSKFANDLPANPLVATKIAAQAVLSIGWALAASIPTWLHPPPVTIDAAPPVAWTASDIGVNIAVVMWTGLLSSAASGWAQAKGQRGVPASEAVVIFATQPLWASALAAVVLGEGFGIKGFIGGGMIVAATLIATQSADRDDDDKQS